MKNKNKWAILNYEIQMYLGARLVQGVQFKPLPGLRELTLTLLQNSAIEVKALHLRILADIFLERNPRFDDINIDDLVPTWRTDHIIIAHNFETAYSNKLKVGSLQNSPKGFLNKYLVHADKRRGDSFDWNPIIRRMDPLLREVFTTLPEENLPALAWLKKLH